MLPQFDISFFFSQIFWTFLALAYISIFSYYVYIPRMSSLFRWRQDTLDKYNRDAEEASVVASKILVDLKKNKDQFFSEYNKEISEKENDVSSKQLSLHKNLIEIGNSKVEDFRIFINKKIQEDIKGDSIYVEETVNDFINVISSKMKKGK